MKNIRKQENGITLIALVVTIIVLLILAGISIAMLTGQNGILNRAAEAKEKTGVAQEDEEKTLQGYEEEKQLFYKFFDLKSFLIMAFMISFGIIIRSFHLLPERFIAVFYTGLGAALFMAGVLFGRNYIQAYRKKA